MKKSHCALSSSFVLGHFILRMSCKFYVKQGEVSLFCSKTSHVSNTQYECNLEMEKNLINLYCIKHLSEIL